MIFIGTRADLEIEPSCLVATGGPLVTVREAWSKVETPSSRQHPPTPSPLKALRWSQTKIGGNHAKVFSLHRLDWYRPSATIQKTVSGGTGMMHPDEPRELTVPELRRLGSFPSEFQFSGRWSDALSSIGNSVPPLFMRAIALHVRETMTAAAV